MASKEAQQIAEIRNAIEDVYAIYASMPGAPPRDSVELTINDMEYITDAMGYLPTREQWADAGLPWVGGAHCADGNEK